MIRPWSSQRPRLSHSLTLCTVVMLVAAALPAQSAPSAANYKLAKRFSNQFLRQFSYSTSIRPQWIGETERFWYSYRTSEGTRWWLVNPVARTRVPLFDHDLLAAQLSEATEKPQNADSLRLTGLKADDKGERLEFQSEGWKFEWVLSANRLVKKGKAPKSSPQRGRAGRGRRGNQERRRRTGDGEEEKGKKEQKDRRLELLMQEQKRQKEEAEKRKKRKESGAREEPERPRRSPFSPDLSTYVFARDHDLYIVRRSGALPPLEDDAKKKAPIARAGSTRGEVVVATLNKGDGRKSGAARRTTGGRRGANGKKTTSAGKNRKKPVFPFDEKKARRLTRDGEEDYEFGGRGRRGRSDDSEEKQKKKPEHGTPVPVTWTSDSKSFYATRGDSRGVAELWLVDSLGKPRPKLQKYKYPMPGEDKVRHSELHVFDGASQKLIRIKQRWKDESYPDVRWLKNGELRVVRRDRPRRHIAYGIVDPRSGAFTELFEEGVKEADLNTQSIRYLEKRKELIWWSERSGWGHYYLYSMDGKLKNAITRGRFRASRIVDVDEENGVLWFRGNGREKGENIYYEHLYSIRLDGGGLTLLDRGDATHRSSLSKSRRFLVDNTSRVDRAPASVLRNAEGRVLMELEKTDLSKLTELGWRPPEPFKVKAADGITDLYGNMWKPFDFNPRKKYPLIVHVYPGPQTEGVTHTFSATSGRQELAQVGFIVIQVGHRGGTPTRSKAYGSYGYGNLRDYGLQDKKAAIEQLAARHAFIDLDRIGIYGHSGGGFMTAAALLKPPYNEFFKVGVSSSGNHDNNVYGYYWAERYHGLKEVERKDEKKAGKQKQGKTGGKGKQEKRRTGDGKLSNGRKKGVRTVRKDLVRKKGGVKDSRKRGKAGKQDQKGKRKKEKDDRFQIKVPTNAELAANLKGKLLLVHGEIDNNVHPAGTMRLVDALIKANKRFDLLIIPGARHGYGRARNYFTQRMYEYFAEHLLGDHQPGADILEKAPQHR